MSVNSASMVNPGEELGAMRLSEAQAELLRFLHERFPTPYRDTGETVTPRAKYQPPTRREALDTIGIDLATWDDSIAFLTSHELAREVYRHGTKEYSALTLAPGHVVLAPIATGSPPSDADPADARYGVHCYQITDRGIQVLEKLATPSPKAAEMSTVPASRNPKVFMSYSWDGPKHQDWVKALAAKLRGHGVDVTLDRWALAPGDQLPQFMETAVRENEHVLIVCTPKYKEKSDARKGGVGYEGDIMTAEALNGQNARKFVPLLRQGEWKEVAPSWLAGKFYRRPSADWARYFVQTWDHPPSSSTMHRPGIARVEGDRVILDGTTVEEVEKVHRDTLKVVLDKVNKDIAEHEARQRRSEEERAERLRQHEQSVRDAAKRMTFD